MRKHIWSEEDLAYIRGNYNKLLQKELAKNLNCTISMLSKQKSRMGLVLTKEEKAHITIRKSKMPKRGSKYEGFPYITKCVVCGEEVQIDHYRYTNSKTKEFTCSFVCQGINIRKDPNVLCYICDKPLYMKPYRLNRLKDQSKITCSKECSAKEREEKMKGEGNHQYGIKGEANGTHKCDFHTTYYGYLVAYSYTHPTPTHTNQVMFHRLVMEEHLRLHEPDSNCLVVVNGQKVLSKEYDVHHKDQHRLNNHISNLQCVTRGEHQKIHSKLKPHKRDKEGRFEKMEQGEILNNGATLYRKHPLDAGQDVCSAEEIQISPRSSAVISTELFIAIPTNCVGLLWSRSGLSVKHQIECGAGCIDSNYRGEVKVHLYNHGDESFYIKKGDRIAQLLTMPINLMEYTPVDKLSSTDRGEKGLGSSGV